MVRAAEENTLLTLDSPETGASIQGLYPSEPATFSYPEFEHLLRWGAARGMSDLKLILPNLHGCAFTEVGFA